MSVSKRYPFIVGRLHTVKQYIIGEDLFGEIGELKKIAKINSHQMKNYRALRPTFFQ